MSHAVFLRPQESGCRGDQVLLDSFLTEAEKKHATGRSQDCVVRHRCGPLGGVQRRDPRADGVFYYAVSTTGIYCRPICPSRRPRRDRVAFFAQPDAARAGGYRACKRCQPDGAAIWRSDGDTAVRHAAVLFVDIKGFTRLTAVMRPDAAMALLRAFHAIVGTAVSDHGGRVQKYLGDGLMGCSAMRRRGPRTPAMPRPARSPCWTA
jgi:hypothetical protein